MTLTYLYLALAVLAASALAGLVFRRRALRLVRMAKAAATDTRLPRPVRWLFRSGIAAKLWPGPDFGVDELALGLGIVLLATRYRKTWAVIRAELS